MADDCFACSFDHATSNRDAFRAVLPVSHAVVVADEVSLDLLKRLSSFASANSCSRAAVPKGLKEFCRRWHFLRPCATVVKHVASQVGQLGEELSEIYFEEAVGAETEAEVAKVAVCPEGVGLVLRPP